MNRKRRHEMKYQGRNNEDRISYQVVQLLGKVLAPAQAMSVDDILEEIK